MRRITVTLLTVVILAAFVSVALAQAPPPAWKQGQPPELATSPLAPIPLSPTPTPAAQIPVGQIKLPPGFAIGIYISYKR